MQISEGSSKGDASRQMVDASERQALQISVTIRPIEGGQSVEQLTDSLCKVLAEAQGHLEVTVVDGCSTGVGPWESEGMLHSGKRVGVGGSRRGADVDLCVVIPVYNEDMVIPELYRRLTAVLERIGMSYEILFVDDGSSDRSADLLKGLRKQDSRIRLVCLGRNFGHQTAISAGIDFSGARAVVVMDADLQDPPEVIPRLVDKWREGYEVVYAVRQRRKEGILKRAVYALFYRLLRGIANTEIPLDSGDFCIMDRRVVDLIKAMPERNRFVRGIRAWVGFRQIGLEYERDRRYAGEVKYSLKKLAQLGLDGLISFSYLPLRLSAIVGSLVSVSAFVLAGWTIYKKLAYPGFIAGFTTIVVGIAFLGGVQLIILGVMGEYIGRIFDEVKQRPLYTVREVIGFGG